MKHFFLPAAMCVCSLAPAAPRVAWQSKFGGNGHDRATAAAADRDGNFVVFGETTSRDFPATTLPEVPVCSWTESRLIFPYRAM